MAIRPIIEAPDTLLRQISRPVEVFDAGLKTLVDDMLETMYDAPGIGLAAIQVGEPLRLLVIDLQEPESDEEDAPGVKNPQIFVNPELSDPSQDVSIYNEGCLSVPEIYVDVERPAIIRVRWHDLTGAPHDALMTGMMATVIQHEMDHLEGILSIDYLSRLKRQMALKKLEKLRKAA